MMVETASQSNLSIIKQADKVVDRLVIVKKKKTKLFSSRAELLSLLGHAQNSSIPTSQSK